MNELKGLGTALITPFKQDGSVDFEALKRLLDTQLTGHVDYIVVLGTTGEAATLTADEKYEVRRFIVNYVRQKQKDDSLKQKDDSLKLKANSQKPIALVLGVGGNNTAQVISELNAMRTELILDFTAILSVCPYYNKPNQEGLFRHFCAVAEASPIPVILYNVPGRTGVNLLPETVIRIYEAHPDKILGIKEASGNLEQIKRLIHLSHRQFAVISGDDGIACEVMKAGGAGLISVASNAFAEDFWHIVHEQDEALQAKYAEMIRLLFVEGNPSGIKTVLAQKGLIENVLRLPLVSNSQAIQDAISHQLSALSR